MTMIQDGLYPRRSPPPRAKTKDERIQELEDRVAELETLLGAHPPKPLPSWLAEGVGMGKTMHSMIGMLLEQTIVSRECAFAVLYGNKPDADQPARVQMIDVHVYRLRKEFAKRGVTIQTVRHVGYCIPLEDKTRLRQYLGW